jgi:hypothetical protein
MKFMYFTELKVTPATREESVLAKQWVRKELYQIQEANYPFEWQDCHLITEVTDFGYDGLFFNLTHLTHARTMERQYMSRNIIRQAEDRPRVLYVAMNKESYDLLKIEAIKPFAKNLFHKDQVKEIRQWLKQTYKIGA